MLAWILFGRSVNTIAFHPNCAVTAVGVQTICAALQLSKEHATPEDVHAETTEVSHSADSNRFTYRQNRCQYPSFRNPMFVQRGVVELAKAVRQEVRACICAKPCHIECPSDGDADNIAGSYNSSSCGFLNRSELSASRCYMHLCFCTVCQYVHDSKC